MTTNDVLASLIMISIFCFLCFSCRYIRSNTNEIEPIIEPENKYELENKYEFIEVNYQMIDEQPVWIVYEKSSKVMYMMEDNLNIQPLYNADGSLMLYEE